MVYRRITAAGKASGVGVHTCNWQILLAAMVMIRYWLLGHDGNIVQLGTIKTRLFGTCGKVECEGRGMPSGNLRNSFYVNQGPNEEIGMSKICQINDFSETHPKTLRKAKTNRKNKKQRKNAFVSQVAWERFVRKSTPTGPKGVHTIPFNQVKILRKTMARGKNLGGLGFLGCRFLWIGGEAMRHRYQRGRNIPSSPGIYAMNISRGSKHGVRTRYHPFRTVNITGILLVGVARGSGPVPIFDAI
ncbi:hypothetical protein DFH07DRAFT_771754 [Mycena maculata]|uniref:Uncharacterized protein n=1 Tax=Mycena maculata TaxID=230809 RepID=A0AAD7JC89_9AGAR|nr:hypothetical protein DFH07DRAFT_771754 [Mycena maculata]